MMDVLNHKDVVTGTSSSLSLLVVYDHHSLTCTFPSRLVMLLLFFLGFLVIATKEIVIAMKTCVIS